MNAHRLIAEYDVRQANVFHHAPLGGPRWVGRMKHIDRICDALLALAEDGDQVAQDWLDAA